MSYRLTGRLQGQIAADRVEPLANMTVRLYHLAAVAPPEARTDDQLSRDFRILTHDEVRSKEYLWLAQAWTNEDGVFTLDLSEDSLLRPATRGSRRAYAGHPLQLDLYCRAAPGQEREPGTEEVQFTVGVLHPRWSDGEEHEAYFAYVLRQPQWAEVRTAMDAWVICGSVASRRTHLPVPGLRVYAYDADLVQDDALGYGVTDAEGRFRIDFSSRRFRATPVGIDVEVGGPDLYFRVENSEGVVLLEEARSLANEGERRDVGNLFNTELMVDA